MSGPAEPAANETVGYTGSVQAREETFLNSSGTYELPAAAPAALVSSLIFSSDVRQVWLAAPAPLLSLAAGLVAPLAVGGFDPAATGAAVEPHAVSVSAATPTGTGRAHRGASLPCTTLPARSGLFAAGRAFEWLGS
jgi:hypothetical protein